MMDFIGIGGPSHHVHTARGQSPQAGLDLIPAVAGGVAGRHPGLVTSPSQDSIHLFIYRAPSTRTNRHAEFSKTPENWTHNYFILRWGYDANLDASLMYFPPHIINNTPKSFQTWPKTRQILHCCDFTAFNIQHFTAFIIWSEVLQNRRRCQFDRSVFQASILHLIFDHQRFSDTAQKHDLRTQQNQR